MTYEFSKGLAALAGGARRVIVLWLKSMESGGAIDMQSNVLGSHPHFGGGAISGYASSSWMEAWCAPGNAAAYGGYVEGDDFVKNNANFPATSMMNLIPKAATNNNWLGYSVGYGKEIRCDGGG